MSLRLHITIIVNLCCIKWLMTFDIRRFFFFLKKKLKKYKINNNTEKLQIVKLAYLNPFPRFCLRCF